MQIIITGGSGFIGRALTDSLTRDGHQVITLSRQANAASGSNANVRFVRWDGRTSQGWGQLVNEADAVVNLAGESIGGTGIIPARWTSDLKQRILESRLNAGRAVLQAIQEAERKPSVLLQSSAVGYYGPHGDEKLTESAAAGNDFLANVCTQWEAVTQPVEALGVRRVCIRTGLVLSPDGGVLPRLMLPFQLFAGGPMGNGKQYYPWIHLEDMIRAIRFLIEASSASGAYNLAAPEPLTNGDFSRILGKVMGRPSWLPAPAFALQLALGEMSTLVLDGQRAVPAHLLQDGFKFNYPELEGALQNLLRS